MNNTCIKVGSQGCRGGFADHVVARPLRCFHMTFNLASNSLTGTIPDALSSLTAVSYENICDVMVLASTWQSAE